MATYLGNGYVMLSNGCLVLESDWNDYLNSKC